MKSIKEVGDISKLSEKEQKKVVNHVRYVSAVLANIRARIQKFGECVVDEVDLMRIWASPLIEPSSGNFRQKVERVAEDMDSIVNWLDKGEVQFCRKIPSIIVLN